MNLIASFLISLGIFLTPTPTYTFDNRQDTGCAGPMHIGTPSMVQVPTVGFTSTGCQSITPSLELLASGVEVLRMYPKKFWIVDNGKPLVEIDTTTGKAILHGSPNRAAKIFWMAVEKCDDNTTYRRRMEPSSGAINKKRDCRMS